MCLTLFVQILQRGMRAESPETPGKATHQTEKTASQALFTLCSGRRHRTWNCDKHTSPLSPLTLVKKLDEWKPQLLIKLEGQKREFSHPVTIVELDRKKRPLLSWSEVKWKSICRVQLFATPWTLQSMGFSRPEYWSGEPFPSPGDLPNPGLPHCRQILYQLSHREALARTQTMQSHRLHHSLPTALSSVERCSPSLEYPFWAYVFSSAKMKYINAYVRVTVFLKECSEVFLKLYFLRDYLF